MNPTAGDVPDPDDEEPDLDEPVLVTALRERGWRAVQKQMETDPALLKDPRMGEMVGFAITWWGDRAVPFVRFLLDHGVDPNATCRGQPLVGCAVEQGGGPKIVQLLLERGADLKRLKNGGRDLLLSAIYVRARKEIIADLIRFGVAKDLIVSLNMDKPRAVLDKLKADPTQLRALDDPTEALARALNSTDLLAFLLSHGVDPNAHGAARVSPLRLAVGAANIDAVRLLLGHGANPNPADAQAEFPVIYAGYSDAQAGRLKAIVDLLIERGARTDDPARHAAWMERLEAAAARHARARRKR